MKHCRIRIRSDWRVLTLSFLCLVIIFYQNETFAQKQVGVKNTLEYFKKSTRIADTICYKEAGGRKLFLLVMKPENKLRIKNRPVLVWIHGGGWTGGNAGQFIPQLRYSADRGAVGISVEYRLIKKNNAPDDGNTTILTDCIADCRDALRYIREHKNELGIDPKRVTVIGDSAGGHLALCMGILDAPFVEKADAVIDCNGITDFNNKTWQVYLPHKKGLDEEIQAFSPLFHLDRNDPPLLILNGGKDKVVTPEEANKLYLESKKAGIDSEYMLFDDMQHAFILTNYHATEEQTTRAMLEIDNFLVKRKLLKGETVLMQQDKLR